MYFMLVIGGMYGLINAGTCVLAIAMIDFYPAPVLRERGPGPFDDTDLARYLTIWTRLHDVIFKCQGPGWGAVGESPLFFLSRVGVCLEALVWERGKRKRWRGEFGVTKAAEKEGFGG